MPLRATPPPAIAVDTAAVGHSDVPIYLEGLGTVQAFYTVTVTARVDGEIQKIGFTEGQTVHKGDLLAQIDPRPNQAAYEQAVATKAKDAAMLANAKLDLDRYILLQPQDLASKQTVDTARANVDQLTAQVQVDQATIDNARTQLDYTRITSPIDGRTGIRLIDPGNIVRAAGTTGIVVVTQVQPISVVFTVPEEDLATVGGALAAGPVQVTTLSRDGNTVLDQGTLIADRQSNRSRPPAPQGSRLPSATRTILSGLASTSMHACWFGPSATCSPCHRLRCSLAQMDPLPTSSRAIQRWKCGPSSSAWKAAA